MDLTVLGCSGSFAAPGAGPCSGYLLRDGDTSIWMDCGNGTFPNLARHVDPADLTAVVITHLHPDHCVDIYGLHVQLRYALGRSDVPVFAPPGAADHLGVLARWEQTFSWQELDEGARADVGSIALRFSQTDHPVLTYAVEAAAGGRRFVYTSDTGPEWEVGAFDPGVDLVLSEASYVHADRRSPIHLSGRQAGEAARAAGVRRLVLTHLWPEVDPEAVHREGSEAFGQSVTLAAVDMTIDI